MIANWIRSGESKEIEFKRDFSSPDKIIETAVAFANTAGGRILIGVNDDQFIHGVPSSQVPDLIDRIQSKIQDQVSPQLVPEIIIYEYEQRQILVVRIYPSQIRPHFLKADGKENGTLIRVGKSNRKADSDMIQNLERQRLNLSFDEEICRSWPYTPENLSELKRILSTRLGRSISDRDLKTLKMIIKPGDELYFSNAAVIISGHLEYVKTRCALFKGVSMNQFLDQKIFDGDVFSQLDATLQFLQRHLNLTEKGNILAQRQDQLEIPLAALREAVVNAFLHRDYSMTGSDIKVAIYDDCVEITSPGSLPNGVQIEEIMRGASEIRNRVIARIFLEARLIEAWGRGIVRMMDLCRESGLPDPQIRENGLFVQITIYRPKPGNGQKPILEKPLAPPQTDTKAVEAILLKAGIATKWIPELVSILEYLQKNPNLSRNQLSKLTQINDSSMKRRLHYLMKAGVLTRIGPDKNGFWQIKLEK